MMELESHNSAENGRSQHMFFAPIFAAVAALTVSTRVEVPVRRTYEAVVVGGGLSDGKVDNFGNDVDVTQAQIDATKALLLQAGIPLERMEVWTADYDATHYGKPKTFVKLGIILVDLGETTTQARAMNAKVRSIPTRGVSFGANEYVSVDCAALKAATDRQLRDAANLEVAKLSAAGHLAKMTSFGPTTDSRTGTFRAIALCTGAHPVLTWAGAGPPVTISDSLTVYASAGVQISYFAAVEDHPVAPEGAVAQFPFGTFGFPIPIIGHQNRQFVLRGGRFAATPGASSVSLHVNTVVEMFPYRTRATFDEHLKALSLLGIPAADVSTDPRALKIYLRLRSESFDRFDTIRQTLSDLNDEEFKFVSDCAPYAKYAHVMALSFSKSLAQTAAETLRVPLGDLVVQTDWAGASSDATCGADGSGDMSSVLSYVNAHGRATYGDPTWVSWSDSVYAAWTLGPKAPKIASASIVERLIPVIVGAVPGKDVTGTATLDPDAYFYTDRKNGDFVTTVVRSKGAVPADAGPGNVITDCAAAQRRALANSIKLAQLDGAVTSLLAKPARLLSIACLSNDYIGHSFSSMPTMYNDSSTTGAAQATDTITVYP